MLKWMSPWKYENWNYLYDLEEGSPSKHDTEMEGICKETAEFKISVFQLASRTGGPSPFLVPTMFRTANDRKPPEGWGKDRVSEGQRTLRRGEEQRGGPGCAAGGGGGDTQHPSLSKREALMCSH